jgi:hypothetical protein
MSMTPSRMIPRASSEMIEAKARMMNLLALPAF